MIMNVMNIPNMKAAYVPLRGCITCSTDSIRQEMSAQQYNVIIT